MMAVDLSQIARAPDSGPAREPLATVRGRIRTRILRRLEWIQHLRSELENGAAGPARRSDALFSVLLQERDTLAGEADFYARTPALERLNLKLADHEAEIRTGADAELGRIAGILQLSDAERDVLEVCLTLAHEPGLCSVLPGLHGDAGASGVSEALVAKICGRPLPLFSASDALVSWKLVGYGDAGPGEATTLHLDPYILGLASGASGYDPLLAPRMRRVQPLQPLADWPVDDVVAYAREVCRSRPLRVSVIGPEGSGRRTFAARVAATLGLEAVAIDTVGVTDADWPDVYLRATRQALLLEQCLIWASSGTPRNIPPVPALGALQFWCGDHDLKCPPLTGLVDLEVKLPIPSVDQRHELWRRLLPEIAAWPEADRIQLVERYRVQVGDIVRIAERGMTEVEQVREQCRQLSRDRLGELGKLLECTLEREDLALPAALNRQLDDFLFEARSRARFWEKPEARRLFPRGRGLVALMTGPPGTGKTTAAQVVARELGLDLIRIDVAASVSKYIGETAKNLRRIFARAREMNAVLLFDEADALFSKRTEVRDAHDRYANTDTNYLLQLLEDHDGVALLASNKKGNIDPAFVRRIRFMLDFPRPGPEERLEIWRRLVRELAGAERLSALEPVLRALANSLELSGAQIKFGLLGALFVAAQEGVPLGLPHLYRGIDRELMKDGRNLSNKDIERVARGGLS